MCEGKGRSQAKTARHRPAGRALAVALGVLSAMAVSACQPATPEQGAQFRPSAEMRTFQVTVPMPQVTADGSSGTIAMPRGFLDDYQRRGRTAMRIKPNGVLTGQAHTGTQVMSNWLTDQGIDAVVLGRPSGTAQANALTLSYEAYVAVVPECGYWDGHTGFNPTNENHPNFGCAMNRNIGLMVSDPGDLMQGRAPGATEAARQDMVIETYRAGEAQGSPLPINESGSITGLGD